MRGATSLPGAGFSEVGGVRIAQVSPWFYPHLGGVESHVRALSAALAARGHDVTVVTTRHDPPPLAAHYATSVAAERGTPSVVTYHCDVEIPSALGALLESLYRRSFGASTLDQATKVVVTTRTYAATSRAVWRHNPAVIPNAVDHRRFHPDVDPSAVRAKLRICPNEPVVLLVGRIEPHK